MPRMVSKYTQVKTYARIFQVAKWTLKQATEQREGSTHNCLAALVFLAFTIEAYVNHLAASKITDWSKRERELGQSRRLRLLLSAVGLDPSFEERPFRSVSELFEIRDQLAHGRSVTIQEEIQDEGDISDGFTPAETEWDKAANPATVAEYLKDVRAIVTSIHRAAGFVDNPFLMLGLEGGRVEHL